MFTKNGIPLYIQLRDNLLETIKVDYKAGDIIPSENKIEQQYGVSKITVRKAIEELEKQGVVKKKQGKGTFVQEQTILYDANLIGSLTQRLSKQNHILKTQSIEYEIIKNEHYVKDLLNCDTLICVKRCRLLNNNYFALMLNYLDIDKAPNLKERFNIESLYTFLKEEYCIEFYNAEETVGAKSATKDEAKQLHVKENYPLLSLQRLSYNQYNEPIEYSDILIKADMYKHKITLSNN